MKSDVTEVVCHSYSDIESIENVFEDRKFWNAEWVPFSYKLIDPVFNLYVSAISMMDVIVSYCLS